MPTFLNRFIFDTRLFLPQHDTSNHFGEIKPHLLWTEQTVDHQMMSDSILHTPSIVRILRHGIQAAEQHIIRIGKDGLYRISARQKPDI